MWVSGLNEGEFWGPGCAVENNQIRSISGEVLRAMVLNCITTEFDGSLTVLKRFVFRLYI